MLSSHRTLLFSRFLPRYHFGGVHEPLAIKCVTRVNYSMYFLLNNHVRFSCHTNVFGVIPFFPDPVSFSTPVLKDDTSDFACDVPFSDTTTGADNDAQRMYLANDVAVGQSIVCTGTYVLTADDIDALQTVSTASAWAVDTFGTEVTSSATTTTSLDQVRSRYIDGRLFCVSSNGDSPPTG